MKALNTNIESKTLAVEPHLWLEIPDVKNPNLLLIHPITQRLANYKFEAAEYQDVILRTVEGRFVGAQARGVSFKSLQKISKNLSISPQEGEIIMGADLAIQLGVFEGDRLMVISPESLLLPLGETPKFDRVVVKEIVTTELRDIDAQSFFYIRGSALEKLRGSNSTKVGLEVWLDRPYEAEKIKESLSVYDNIQIDTWKDRNSALFLALKIEKIVIGTFLGVAGLIATFSLSTLLVLLISQKKRDIGILQAMGFSQRRSRVLFMSLGIFLGFLGLAIGVLIGSGLSYYLELNPLQVLPDIYYDSSIPAEMDTRLILWVLGLGVLVVIAEVYLSSLAIKNFSTSEALKSKH